MKLGLLPVQCKPGSLSYIEASEIVYISRDTRQGPDGPKSTIRLSSGEEAYTYDDPAELALIYSELVRAAR